MLRCNTGWGEKMRAATALRLPARCSPRLLRFALRLRELALLLQFTMLLQDFALPPLFTRRSRAAGRRVSERCAAALLLLSPPGLPWVPGVGHGVQRRQDGAPKALAWGAALL